MVSVSARLTAKRSRWTFVKFTLLLAATVLAVWPAGARAQYFPANSIPNTFNDQSTSGVVLLGRKDGLLGPYADTGYFGPYLHLQHVAGDGPGYRDNGFTSIGLFAPRRVLNGMMYFDGRLSVNDFGNMIGNVGSGYRYFSPNLNRTFGGSLWYDVDSGHNSSFSQGGVSLETRGQGWDFFLNGYFPLGDDSKEFNRIITPTGAAVFGFSQNFLAVNRPNLVTRQIEVAMTGVDAEFGGPLPVVGKYGIRGYGGYYHYNGDNISDVNGGRFRLQADFTDSLTGQFLLTNDSKFDTSAIFTVTWTMPGSGASRSEFARPGFNRSGRAAVVRGQSPEGPSTISQYYRMFQPTQRSQRVFVASTNRREVVDNFIVLTDPTTGLPIEIFHMDSRAAAGGDGSFETPFANPQEAQAGTGAGDVIFTHAGSVFDNPANNFIALQQNQQLLGEGIPHFISTFEEGAIEIPASGDAGGLPVFQGGGGIAAVEMANGSRMSGFVLNDSVVAAIRADESLTAGSSALIENTTINRGAIGLNVMNLAGTVNFADTSSINNTTVAALNVGGAMTTGTVNVEGPINNSTGRAININDLPAGGVVNVNGMVTDNGGTGINIGTSSGNVNIANANLMIPAGNGVTLTDNLDGVIRFGQIDVTTAAGNAFVSQTTMAAANSGNLFVTNGNLNATGGQALILEGNMAPLTMNVRFNDVTSTGSPGAGVTVDTASGTLAITGTTTIDGTGGNGFEFIDSSASVTVATLNIGNTTGTTGAAVFLRDNGGMDDRLTGNLVINGGLITNSMGPSFQVSQGSATSIFRGEIQHTTAGSEIVQIVGTGPAGNNVFDAGSMLTATNGLGILIRDADGDASFLGTTDIDGPSRGVLIDTGSTGTYTFSNMASITDTASVGFEINNSAPQVIYEGMITHNTAGFEAVLIDGLGALGNAAFNGEVDAGTTSQGVRIINSAGDAFFANYNNLTSPLSASTSLTLMNNTGTYEFEMLDIRTTGDGNLGIDANNGGTFIAGGTTFAGAGTVASDGETAVSITNGTQLGLVNLRSVTAVNTVGGGAFDGVFLSDIAAGGLLSINNGIAGDTIDLMVNGTAGGDGFRAVNFESQAQVGGADIFNTGGGDGIEINGGAGSFIFGTLDIGDPGVGNGLGSGNGVNIVDTDGFQTFQRTNVENTGGGHGIRVTGLGMNNILVFDDGDSSTMNDVRIDDTGGATGDGINISNTMDGSQIGFGSVNITNTGGGHGVEIGNGGMAGMGVDGLIVFNDSNGGTLNDLTINNTGGGDGIHIEETLSNAFVTFFGVDIDNTVTGDGINISNMADGLIRFTDQIPATAPNVQITATGGGDGIELTNLADTLNLQFSSVSIDTTFTGAAMGGHGLNIHDTGGTIVFNDGDSANPTPNLFDLDIRNTGGGDGIHIEDSLATLDLTFSTVRIDTTSNGGNLGNGVAILGNGAPAVGMVAFGDGDMTTGNDLTILNTGGGDGIDITNTGAGGTFTFSSVDIDTGGGIGLDIDMANGTITFDDMAGTDTDLTITNTGGSDGIEISNSNMNAMFTFAGIDVSNTGVGNGVELINNLSDITFDAGDIRNAGGAAFSVTGEGANVTYDGTISDNTAGLLVNVQDRTGGIVDFNGSLTSRGAGQGIMISGALGDNSVFFDGDVNLGISNLDVVSRLTGGTAVDIDNNTTNSTIRFADLDIFTMGQAGLVAANGGSLEVTTGRINTVSGQAINLNGIDMNTITLANSGVGLNGRALAVDGAGGAGVDAVSFTNVTGTFTVNGQTTITNTSSAYRNGIFIDGEDADYVFNPAAGQTTTISGSTADAVVYNNTTGGSLMLENLTIPDAGASAISIDSSVGDVTVNMGNIATAAASTQPVVEINGGTGDFTFNDATLTQNNSAVGSAVSVTGGHTGTATFNAGSTVTAMMGDGLQFNDADGTYNFQGTTTLNGGDAGIDILGDSDGTFTFAATTSITNPTGVAFNVVGDTTNSPTVTYSGTIVNNAMAAVNIQDTMGGTITFNSAVADAIADSGAGTGIVLNNVGSTVNFTADTELTGASGIDIDGGSGTFTFADTDINVTGPAFDVSGGTSSVNFQVGSSITQASANTTVSVLNHMTGTIDFDGDVTDTAGTGFEFNNADGTYSFDGTNALSGTDGIDILNGSGGTFTFGPTTIDGVTGNGLDVDGGDATITFGTLAIMNTDADAIDISDTTGGSVTIGTANLTLLGAGTDGISLTDNTGNFVLNGGDIDAVAGQNGIVASYNNSNGDISIIGTVIDGGDNGINVTATGTSAFQMLIDNNMIGQGTAPTTNGILIDNQGTGELDVTITRNTVVGGTNGLNAIQSNAGGTLSLNIGTNMANGTATGNGFENDFSSYVFDNDGTMELGVTGNVTAIGDPIPNTDLDAELNEFGNQAGGNAVVDGDVTTPGANDLDAVNPNTILPP